MALERHPEQIAAHALIKNVIEHLKSAGYDSNYITNYQLLLYRLAASPVTVPQSWTRYGEVAYITCPKLELVLAPGIMSVIGLNARPTRSWTCVISIANQSMDIVAEVRDRPEAMRKYTVKTGKLLYPSLWSVISYGLFHTDFNLWTSPGLPQYPALTSGPEPT